MLGSKGQKSEAVVVVAEMGVRALKEFSLGTLVAE